MGDNDSYKKYINIASQMERKSKPNFEIDMPATLNLDKTPGYSAIS